MLTKEQGESEATNEASEEIIYRIEIAANRYDLLCLEGLADALLVFLKKWVIFRIEFKKTKFFNFQETTTKVRIGWTSKRTSAADRDSKSG